MTTSLANINLDLHDWTDLCVLYPAVVNSDVILRHPSPLPARIVHGGATRPVALTGGDLLNPHQAVYANCDHIWVTGHGALSVTML